MMHFHPLITKYVFAAFSKLKNTPASFVCVQKAAGAKERVSKNADAFLLKNRLSKSA